ncbi:hypothetical protein MFLAVUS_008631 [Mucor flavus]|uniref:Uncharacterized protein n=1 Tax=Mucor flavus TaxID=439312 RepID=A0ABP9Z7M6_9FUNG
MRISIAIFILAVPSVLAAVIIRPDSKAQSIVEDNNAAGCITNILQMRPNSVTYRAENVSSQHHSIAASVSAVASISKQWSPVSYHVQSERETYIHLEYKADKADTYAVSPPIISEARPLAIKVEISVGDIYFSQTDSYSVPDLSSIPFIKNYPDFPDNPSPAKENII